MSRDKAIAELKKLTHVKSAMDKEDIRREIVALAKDLPKTGRITYGSKDMEPFRERVDGIVSLLLCSDGKAMRSHKKFLEAVHRRETTIRNGFGKSVLYSNKNMKPADTENASGKYRCEADERNITLIQDLYEDYKRRQGNLVLRLAKFIKPEFYEVKGKHKANDIRVKRSLGISRNKTVRACNKFFRSFGTESEFLERDFSRRLQEIEEEIERERKKKQNSSGDGNGSGGETK